jgi:hypothetical protein
LGGRRGAILLGEVGTLELRVARCRGKLLELELVHTGSGDEGNESEKERGEKHGGCRETAWLRKGLPSTSFVGLSISY